MTKVAVFGLGYVGSVSAAALADGGHDVVGVDVNTSKVEMIASGRSPIVEEGLAELIADVVRSGRLTATADAAGAVASSDISMICVGSPSRPNGDLDLDQVTRVAGDIGAALRSSSSRHVVVVRSTLLPGSTEAVVIPALEEASGLRAGEGFSVCVNPEFLREGSSLRDYRDPPFTLIGTDDVAVAQRVAGLYEAVDADRIVVPVPVAEMVKYASNAFHAVKVTFANEVGAICRQSGVDSHAVMDIVCRDGKLNTSAAYLKPGFAFGGSCLPKDLRALTYHARRKDVEAPLLESLMESNAIQVRRAVDAVTSTGSKRIGILGFSFKAGTDDLRESPVVEVIERLIGKGYDVRVYDANVSLANLRGANREYIEREIPHIASLMCDSVDEVLEESDVVVIGNRAPEFAKVPDLVTEDHVVIDLVRILPDIPAHPGYRGIGW